MLEDQNEIPAPATSQACGTARQGGVSGKDHRRDAANKFVCPALTSRFRRAQGAAEPATASSVFGCLRARLHAGCCPHDEYKPILHHQDHQETRTARWLLPAGSHLASFIAHGAGTSACRCFNRAIGHLQDAEVALGGCNGNTRRKFAAHLTTSHLLALISVIASRSYTLAATQLQVTQPAITMALRDLQDAVGATLLQKGPGGVSPTPAGALLADAARRAIAELESMPDVVRVEPRPAPERVVIGVLPLAGTFVPAKAVESFLESFPYANLTLVEGPYAHC